MCYTVYRGFNRYNFISYSITLINTGTVIDHRHSSTSKFKLLLFNNRYSLYLVIIINYLNVNCISNSFMLSDDYDKYVNFTTCECSKQEKIILL